MVMFVPFANNDPYCSIGYGIMSFKSVCTQIVIFLRQTTCYVDWSKAVDGSVHVSLHGHTGIGLDAFFTQRCVVSYEPSSR